MDKTQLVENSFTGLIELKRLELYRCDFKNFPCNSFSDINTIEVLTVKRSLNYEYVDFGQLENLKWLHVEFFSEMEVLDSFTSNLEVLKIENSARPINFFAFKNTIKKFRTLKVLELECNKFIFFCINWLRKQTALEKLIITTCNLRRFDLKLPKSVKLEKLNEINIMGHHLTELPENDFINTPRLEKLFLVANHIKTITIKSFRNVAALKILDLTSNQIESIEAKSFSHSVNLEILKLSCNQLTELKSDMFDGLEKLKELWINRNPLKEIDSYLFAKLLNIKIIYLDRLGNKQCEQNLIDYFKDRKNALKFSN